MVLSEKNERGLKRQLVGFNAQPVRHPRNKNHHQDANNFLVETANMADNHHPGCTVVTTVTVPRCSQERPNIYGQS